MPREARKRRRGCELPSERARARRSSESRLLELSKMTNPSVTRPLVSFLPSPQPRSFLVRQSSIRPSLTPSLAVTVTRRYVFLIGQPTSPCRLESANPPNPRCCGRALLVRRHLYGSTMTMNVAVYVTGEPYALYEFLVTRAIGIVTATRSPLAESWTLLWLWRPRNLHP